MAASVLSQPHFHDEAAAYKRLEAIVWPEGPHCPRCGALDRITDVTARVEKATEALGQLQVEGTSGGGADLAGIAHQVGEVSQIVKHGVPLIEGRGGG